jgi:hypothetical protein
VSSPEAEAQLKFGFQGLEKSAPVFPGIGKFHRNFSKPWKITAEFFRGLELTKE